jgi:hypothetical protein
MKRLLAAVLILVATASQASLYRITVTRKADNLYKVDGTSIFIKTRYCYEYAYSEEAILDDTRDELIFTSGGSKCDVETVIR